MTRRRTTRRVTLPILVAITALAAGAVAEATTRNAIADGRAQPSQTPVPGPTPIPSPSPYPPPSPLPTPPPAPTPSPTPYPAPSPPPMMPVAAHVGR
jgi:hypothetical protein